MSGLPALDCPFTEADVRAAQTVIDAWERQGTYENDERDLLQLRGLLAQTLSDVRYAGYVEGVQQGRKQIGHMVHEALRDEGI